LFIKLVIEISLGLDVSTLKQKLLSCILPHCILDICKRWGSHNALEDLVLDVYLRGPEDDLTRVETYSPRFMYICTVNKTVVLD